MTEIRKLAPIAVVMLPEALAFWSAAAAFERKAGSPFPSSFIVSLL